MKFKKLLLACSFLTLIFSAHARHSGEIPYKLKCESTLQYKVYNWQTGLDEVFQASLLLDAPLGYSAKTGKLRLSGRAVLTFNNVDYTFAAGNFSGNEIFLNKITFKKNSREIDELKISGASFDEYSFKLEITDDKNDFKPSSKEVSFTIKKNDHFYTATNKEVKFDNTNCKVQDVEL